MLRKSTNFDGRISITASAALRDIAHHIDLAVHFTTGFDYKAFVATRARLCPDALP
jgi:hypothetical protein